jgi:hypothetical protein
LKQVVIFIVLSISIVLKTGSYFFCEAYIDSYKKEYRTYIVRNSKHISKKVITINKADLYINSANMTWEDDNQELVYDKLLYDVIDIKSITNKIQITLVTDDKEQQLKNQFTELYNCDITNKENKPLKLLKQFLALKCIINSANVSPKVNFASINKVKTLYLLNITYVYLKQETPPPIFLNIF